MESFFESDIFFSIVRIATIVFAVLAVVAIVYAIAILRDVKNVTGQVKTGTKKAGTDALPMIRSIAKALGALFLVSVVKKIRGKK